MNQPKILQQSENDILFIGGTHGDEPIGVDALRRLEKTRNDFDWIIGSEEALARGTREFEGDLNRSAPGSPTAANYAGRRAAEIIQLSQEYRYTIDIHGSEKDNGIFLIITALTQANLRLATRLDVERVILWPSDTAEMAGPMSEFFPCGLEIECGVKTDPVVIAELNRIITDFLDTDRTQDPQNWEAALDHKHLYHMQGPLHATPEAVQANLKEFKEVTIDNEKLTPIFIGSYDYDNILAYKLQKIDSQQALSLTTA